MTIPSKTVESHEVVDSSSSLLASKDDIYGLKLEISEINSDIKHLKFGVLLILCFVLPGALKTMGLVN